MAIRSWRITAINPGVSVSLANFLVPDPGETIDVDTPPTATLSWAQWLTDHGAVYGLTTDGRVRSQITAVRAAAARLVTKAQSDQDWAALVTVIRWIADPSLLMPPD
jgi:hypothetical protein